jgi:hypothetical protein
MKRDHRGSLIERNLRLWFPFKCGWRGGLDTYFAIHASVSVAHRKMRKDPTTLTSPLTVVPQ